MIETELPIMLYHGVHIPFHLSDLMLEQKKGHQEQVPAWC